MSDKLKLRWNAETDSVLDAIRLDPPIKLSLCQSALEWWDAIDGNVEGSSALLTLMARRIKELLDATIVEMRAKRVAIAGELADAEAVWKQATLLLVADSLLLEFIPGYRSLATDPRVVIVGQSLIGLFPENAFDEDGG